MSDAMRSMATGIGTRIAKRRQVLGMTQDELAERVGVSRSTVGNWEVGKHFPKRYLGKVEAVLGVTLDSSGDGPEYDDPYLQQVWETTEGESEQRRRAIVEMVREGRKEHPRIPEELRRRFREVYGDQRGGGAGRAS